MSRVYIYDLSGMELSKTKERERPVVIRTRKKWCDRDYRVTLGQSLGSVGS